MRYLVTGAAGLIGFEIAKQLLQRGDSVVACDSYRKGGNKDLAQLAKEFSTLEIISGDLLNPTVLDSITGKIDGIFHMAAIVGVAYVDKNPYETLKVNTISTLNVTDFAVSRGCGSVVFASSSENYASAVDRGWISLPTPEEVPLCIGDISLPRWSYAVSKIAGESAVFAASHLNSSIRPIVIRFHNVYGPRMGPTHVIPEFLERAAKRLDPFPVYGYDATRSFLYVEDAARAVLLVHDSGKQGIFNVGSSEEVSIEKLLQLILDVGGYSPKVEPHPAPPGSVKRRVPTVSRIEKLGFKPRVSLNEGISTCYKHLLDKTQKHSPRA